MVYRTIRHKYNMSMKNLKTLMLRCLLICNGPIIRSTSAHIISYIGELYVRRPKSFGGEVGLHRTFTDSNRLIAVGPTVAQLVQLEFAGLGCKMVWFSSKL